MRTFLAAMAGLVLATSGAAAQGVSPGPTVLELFTSQGCSSCPPADALLGDLAQRDDLIALTYHVTYWDYIGWKDTFASKESTDRQYAYQGKLNTRYVYTPQLVVGGVTHAVGSDRSAVEAAIRKVVASARPVALAARPAAGGGFDIALPAGQSNRPATVWLVGYDRRHDVAIGRGENGGRTLSYYNVVRGLKRLGAWSGQAKELAVAPTALPDGERLVMLLQSDASGEILGAQRLER